jgi:hypothetical protein
MRAISISEYRGKARLAAVIVVVAFLPVRRVSASPDAAT